MITKFKVYLGMAKIEVVEVVKETDMCVYVEYSTGGVFTAAENKTRRENKISNYQCYFDSFDEAQSYLINNILPKVEKAEDRFTFLCKRRAEIENLTIEDCIKL